MRSVSVVAVTSALIGLCEVALAALFEGAAVPYRWVPQLLRLLRATFPARSRGGSVGIVP